MIGVAIMTTQEANFELLRIIPDEMQEDIYNFILSRMEECNPYKPLSREEIYAILEESHKCVENGQVRKADEFLDEIGKVYGFM